MPNWTLDVMVGGLDRTAAVFGAVRIKREGNAAAIARLALRPPAGTLDQDAYVGMAVSIDAVWDAGGPVRRFTGSVDTARWDAGAGLLNLDCTDGLREAMRGRTTAQVVAKLPGARWEEKCFGPETDGWEQFKEAVKTLDFRFFLNADGTERWVSRAAAGLPDFELTAAQVLEGSVAVTTYEQRELVNRVQLDFQARGVILHHWECGASWTAYPSGEDFCDYRVAPWWLPWQERISGAVEKAGWRVKQRTALASAGSSGGVRFTGLPESTGNPCGNNAPWVLPANDPRATFAQWTAVFRWEQTCRRHYAITVEAPDAVAAHGALEREERVGYDEGEDERGWQSGSGAQTPSGGTWANPTPAHWQDVTLDQAAADLVLECGLAIEVARVLDAYRGNRVRFEALSANDLFALEVADTVRLVAVPVLGLETTATGTVEAIDEYWDPERGDAGIVPTLGVSRCPGAGGTDDPVAAPAAPSLDPGYVLDAGISLPTHIGGRIGSAVFDADWRGWVTNLEIPKLGEEFYDVRQFAVEYPKRPTAAKESVVANAAATFRVYPPHDELVQELV